MLFRSCCVSTLRFFLNQTVCFSFWIIIQKQPKVQHLNTHSSVKSKGGFLSQTSILLLLYTSIYSVQAKKIGRRFRCPCIKTKHKIPGHPDRCPSPARATSVHPESSSGVSKRPQRGLKRPLADHQRGL